MTDTQIHSTVDFEAPGKQIGHLAVPYSYDLAGWANLQIPICVIANGEGPTVLLLAGNHGDEYPGQIAILKLLRELEPSDVRGRLIMIPILNPPASRAGTRLSPLDGQNFNRSFPGRAEGSVSDQLAYYLTTTLFPMSEYVIDLHTGGRSTDFYPCAHMHLVEDREQRRRMVAGTLAYNTDFAFLYTDIAGTGLLPVEAERQGKIVITTEMGGAESITASLNRLSQDGLRNVLVHTGVLEGDFKTRADLGLPPTRWVQSLDREDYRFAPESGIYESLVDLGQDVPAGETVGQIHSLERPDRAPVPIVAPTAGVLLGDRGPSVCSQGDCVAVIAHDVDPSALE
ncbi:MAG: succinylglutamate desuccinylase/aspartoacylase family protein [Gemmatimonadetes bacterium]|nr:succinylglutamate desuccinylase/aspartoacylase family protein [Gemmatimonadota bacterium]